MKEIVTDIFGSALLIAIFVLIISQVYKTYRDRNKPGHSSGMTNIVYGSWQGHNLGTTMMEPGDLTRIEEKLRETPEKDQE